MGAALRQPEEVDEKRPPQNSRRLCVPYKILCICAPLRAQTVKTEKATIHMKLLLFLFSVSILPALQAQSLPISIDSRFDDWTADADILTDDPNDGTGIELLQMEIANDEGHLFIQLETDDEINLTEGHQLTLYLDTDLDPSTGVAVNGIGAELSVMPGQREVYYQLPGGSGYLSLNDIGFRHLPSVSSTRFEMAFDLQAVSNAGADLFPSGGVRMVWIDKGGPAGDAMPDNGSVFTYLFDPDPVAPVVPVSFDKASPNAIRMLTWNTENNGLDDIDREAFFKKILRAVQPDIVTFNECWDINAFQVASFMNAAVPLGNFQSWKAVKLDQGNVTASRFPILQSWLIFPNHRLTASLIDIPQSISAKDLLVVNGHLRCCDNDYERQLEADAFVQFILDAKTPGGIIDLPPGTPFVLSGDLNLVGNRQQLTTLLTGEVVNTAQYGPGGPLDWDDSNLEDVIGLHTDDRFAFTWRNNFSSFPPSRIDFQIVSGSVLE
ncbi:MAG TPA: endonuclease/exonuclease/phosphatase family protein, partial [Bacteroidetes bacterium]|nr:endonuclease/exonuclease/phosphatase family protein [Bacteroidota bacterium]